MQTDDYISMLKSSCHTEADEAVQYFLDLFSDGGLISDKDYVKLFKTLTRLLMAERTGALKADLLLIMETSLYSDSKEATVSGEAFVEAIAHVAQTKEAVFSPILKPLLAHPKLKPIIEEYFEGMGI
jgi:hypothetical protein